MLVPQICPTYGERCGLAYFAGDLAAAMAPAGIDMPVVRSVATGAELSAPDLLILHYHSDVVAIDDLRLLAQRAPCPVVLLAHSDWASLPASCIDAVVTLCNEVPQRDGLPVLDLPHPAWTPPSLAARPAARAEVGLAPGVRTAGTCGFLRYDRQLDEMASALLPHAVAAGWQILLVTSPWRLPTPGVMERLQELRASAPSHLALRHGYLSAEALNLHLQACDLLWCWTAEPSAPYGSGVASAQYASGSRLVVADKLQHRHVLDLPNVVPAAADFDRFVSAVVAEMGCGDGARHAPEAVSWRRQVGRLAAFFAASAARGVRRHAPG